MKPKHKRLMGVLTGLLCIAAGTFFLLNKFQDNLVYFYPPSEIYKIDMANPEKFNQILHKEIRVGGMVKENSYEKLGEKGHRFTVTDYDKELTISFEGLLPPMFREGQGVVAQGKIAKAKDGKQFVFHARTLLTKHDEKYMPPEITRNLKQKPTTARD